MTEHDQFMHMALEAARVGAAQGNRPVGSVIVRGGAVISTGYNTVISEGDPTNHAETVAIRTACHDLDTLELSGATLYTTMEPCPMCLWAISITRIDRLVLGARHAAFRPLDYGDYSVERLLDLSGRKLDLVTGVLTDACEAMRRD